MPITDEQRTWLDAALQSKGRFTSAKSIKGDFADYVRRRDKVDAALAGIDFNGSDRSTVQNAMKAADELAKAGKFEKAYKDLAAVKKMARAAANKRAVGLTPAAIGLMLDTLDKTTRNRIRLAELIIANLNSIVSDMGSFAKASDQPSFDAACATWATYHQAEVVKRAKLAETQALFARFTEECKVHIQQESINQKLSAAKVAGREREFAAEISRMDKINTTLAAKPDLVRLDKITAVLKAKTLEFEKASLAISSMGQWQKRDGTATTPDAKTDTIRGKLDQTDNRLALMQREKDRLKSASDQMKRETRADKNLVGDTGRGKVDLTPEPVPFDPGDVFSDIVKLNEVLPAVIPPERAKAIEKASEQALKGYLASVDPKSDALFDLSLKRADDFANMMAAELFGVDSVNDLTDSQQKMVQDAARTLEKTLCESCPNKMADDGSEVAINGTKYTLKEVIKAGGNGTAKRYLDPATGKTVVVKTMNKPSDTEVMVEEMQTHRRAMNGVDDPDDTAIVRMEGAARSEDGNIHMVMEDVDGGDLEDMANSLTIMQQLGIMPPAAKNVLTVDMVTRTAKALMELERQGLVHHDMKGENVMMTADGRLKIIDYGEARFGDEKGVVRNQNPGATPGYVAPDGSTYDSKFDTFALGGMLQKLVAGDTPTGADPNYKAGALGRLIVALKSEDPADRPSLEAVMMSALSQSATRDHAPGDVEDLKEASAEFTALVAKETVDVPAGLVQEKLPALKGLVNPGKTKLKNLSGLANSLDDEIQKLQIEMRKQGDAYLSTGKHELEALQKQRDILRNELIAPAMDAKAAQGERAYKTAIDNPANKVTVPTPSGPKNVTLKDAVAFRDKIVAKIAEVQDKFNAAISPQDPSTVDMAKVKELNDKLTEVDVMRKGVDAAIYKAMGPEAKFYLSKVKMENVAKKFGTLQQRVEQQEVEEDELMTLLSTVIKSDEASAIRAAAR
jgi:serine/threonine protein kinase